MSEQLLDLGEQIEIQTDTNKAGLIEGLGKITVFEALAEETDMVGFNRSNMTTPSAGDADDQ